MWHMGALDSLEQAIQRLAEEPFVRILGDWLLPHHVAHALARAIEDSESLGMAKRSQASLCYVIELNPTDLDHLKRMYPDLERQLGAALARAAAQWRPQKTPVVVLEKNEQIASRDVNIRVTTDAESVTDSTRELRLSSQSTRESPVSSSEDIGAYLVIEGGRIFDLRQPRTRIGRALDNDLILDAPQVSRYHAVLEQRFGRYVLRDLRSTQGTWVNGFRVTEAVLRSGDVISLADVEIVYAESAPLSRPGQGQTQQVPRVES